MVMLYRVYRIQLAIISNLNTTGTNNLRTELLICMSSVTPHLSLEMVHELKIITINFCDYSINQYI